MNRSERRAQKKKQKGQRLKPTVTFHYGKMQKERTALDVAVELQNRLEKEEALRSKQVPGF